jgi:hypothetical protein
MVFWLIRRSVAYVFVRLGLVVARMRSEMIQTDRVDFNAALLIDVYGRIGRV